MKNLNLFLVGAGLIPLTKLKAGGDALTKAWGCELIHRNCDMNPRKVLEEISFGSDLVLLEGDAAVTRGTNSSWLEALGAWKQPIVLLASPLSSGEIPGNVRAYGALCKELCVPLIGVVQIGEPWDEKTRRVDELPWCGLINNEAIKETENGSKDDEGVLEIVELLKRRLALNLQGLID